MASDEKPVIGPVGQQVVRNILELARIRGLSLRDLSKALGELGVKAIPSVLHRLAKNQRRVDADDLLAFALVLGVNPNALLLPRDADPDADVGLAPKVSARAWAAWAWADGRLPLPPVPGSAAPAERRFTREVDFSRNARPAFGGQERTKLVSEVYEFADQVEALEAAEDPELQDMLRDRVNRTLRRLVPDVEDLFARRPGLAGAAALTAEQLREAIRALPEPEGWTVEPFSDRQ
jgi:transcriptional regulator with XRE-family HTH domain